MAVDLEKLREETRKNIERYVKQFGDIPTVAQYKEFTGVKFPKFHFKSYQKFLKDNGFEPKTFEVYTNEEVLAVVKEYIEKNGVPSISKIAKCEIGRFPSRRLITKRFGNYTNMLALLGYSTGQAEYTKDEVIKYVRDGIDSGKVKNTTDLLDKTPSLDTIYTKVGVKGWRELLEKIDRLDIYVPSNTNRKKKYTKEQLKEMYIKLSKDLGKAEHGASMKDVRKHLGVIHTAFSNAFKKPWQEIKKEWGYTPIPGRCIYSRHDILKSLAISLVKRGKLTAKYIGTGRDKPSAAPILRCLKTLSPRRIEKMLIDEGYVKPCKNGGFVNLKKEIKNI